MSEAVEVVSFKLAGCSVAQFVAANAGMDAWLARQPGFRSRRIAEAADGSIVDVLVWASRAQAQAALVRMLRETADSPVHAMIDQGSVSWSLATVRRCAAVAENA